MSEELNNQQSSNQRSIKKDKERQIQKQNKQTKITQLQNLGPSLLRKIIQVISKMTRDRGEKWYIRGPERRLGVCWWGPLAFPPFSLLHLLFPGLFSPAPGSLSPFQFCQTNTCLHRFCSHCRWPSKGMCVQLNCFPLVRSDWMHNSVATVS